MTERPSLSRIHHQSGSFCLSGGWWSITPVKQPTGTTSSVTTVPLLVIHHVTWYFSMDFLTSVNSSHECRGSSRPTLRMRGSKDGKGLHITVLLAPLP